MRTVDISLETDEIKDWDSFHEACKTTFGFPDFYGQNMNAWIDCLTYLDEEDGMSRFYLKHDEMLNINVVESGSFKQRVPEIFDALIECAAFVNQRYIERGSSIRIALTLL
ncbi:MAG: barstar family protein [Acidobacteria bacterium]|nr:barstar family protein [Acidobacteriota bacterium]